MIDRVGFAAELAAYTERHGQVTIGLAGAGQMGTDIVVQVALMTGIRVGAIAANRPTRPMEAIAMAGYPEAMASSPPRRRHRPDDRDGRHRRDRRSQRALRRRPHRRHRRRHGQPGSGTFLALEAIRNGKHIVMLNVEADITVGRLLARKASEAGIVYTGLRRRRAGLDAGAHRLRPGARHGRSSPPARARTIRCATPPCPRSTRRRRARGT